MRASGHLDVAALVKKTGKAPHRAHGTVDLSYFKFCVLLIHKPKKPKRE